MPVFVIGFFGEDIKITCWKSQKDCFASFQSHFNSFLWVLAIPKANILFSFQSHRKANFKSSVYKSASTSVPSSNKFSEAITCNKPPITLALTSSSVISVLKQKLLEIAQVNRFFMKTTFLIEKFANSIWNVPTALPFQLSILICCDVHFLILFIATPASNCVVKCHNIENKFIAPSGCRPSMWSGTSGVCEIFPV